MELQELVTSCKSSIVGNFQLVNAFFRYDIAVTAKEIGNILCTNSCFNVHCTVVDWTVYEKDRSPLNCSQLTF